jgi:tetratricopeptide (TPR) repeat protein
MMMNPAVNATLNQQLMSGYTLAQQGTAAESVGNAAGAAQLYDQAIQWIYQSMMTAMQWNVFIPDTVHASLANAHNCAARVKNQLGLQPVAWQHLNQSLMSLNQAIAQNPNVAGYHAAAGTIMMSMGNLPEAERAFSAAQRLAPSDPQSQQMLGMLQSMRAAMTPQAGMPPWGGAQQMPPMPFMGAGPMPGMMPGGMQGMSSGAAPGQSPQSSAPGDWMKTVNNVCSTLDSVFKTVGNFDNMMQKFN